MAHTLILEPLTADDVPTRWLIPGQTMNVGRTQWADHQVESDGFMSSVHFRIECLPRNATIQDLGSRNGTFLNGVRIDSSLVASGDIVTAGETTFRIRLQPQAQP